jgi:hypothetical protein
VIDSVKREAMLNALGQHGCPRVSGQDLIP